MEELLTNYFTGVITPGQRAELFRKIQCDKQLEDDFIALQNAYALSAFLPAEGDERKAQAHLVKQKQAQKRHKRMKVLRKSLSYAAIFLLGIALSWAIFSIPGTDSLSQPTTAPHSALARQEYYVPSGQRACVTLQDGTVIWLNARSSLSVPMDFGINDRRVKLDGEAYFEVAEDTSHPFIVNTSQYNVLVTGTHFNVFAYSHTHQFCTSLLEGSVQIYQPDKPSEPWQLKPNEKLETINGHLQKSTFANQDFMLWKDGIYPFDDVPFQAIMDKLELYYDISITVLDPQLKQVRFSGKFRQRDGVESALKALQRVYPFSYTKDDNLNTLTIK